MPYFTVKDVLQKSKISAFLVTNKTNIRYISGIDMSAGAILISGRAMTLFTDGRYLEKALHNKEKIKVKDIKNLQKTLSKITQCGFESDSVTVHQLQRWKKQYKTTKFIPCSGIIESFRRTKQPSEIKLFKKAQDITQQIIERIPSALEHEISEKELAWKLQEWARALGADCLSFDPIVAFGTHTSRPHHEPTDRKLKNGHIVQIDVGAQYKGYCADQSAVFFTADPTAEQECVYNAVLQAKDAAIAAVESGVSAKEIDGIARQVLKEYKLENYFTHALGHGVGLDIHEAPTISSKVEKEVLQKGDIITIEPGVYIPGKFGMRLEEEIIVG